MCAFFKINRLITFITTYLKIQMLKIVNIEFKTKNHGRANNYYPKSQLFKIANNEIRV